MTISIFANPGQNIKLYLPIKDDTGQLHDGYQAPTVDFIINPIGAFLPNYPQNMTEVSLGIWQYSLLLPAGNSGLGTWLISCSWPDPNTAIFQNELFLINVAAAFGLITAIPG